MKERVENIINQLKEITTELKNGLSANTIKEKESQIKAVEKSILELRKQNIDVPDDLRKMKIELSLSLDKFNEYKNIFNSLSSELNKIQSELSNISNTSLKKAKRNRSKGNKKLIEANVKLTPISNDRIIQEIISSPSYQNFKTVLDKKEKNESEAKNLLINNLGHLSSEHIKKIFSLVNEPYTYNDDKRPWFGSLCSVPNTINLFRESNDKLNNWFNYLFDEKISMEDRIYNLTNPESHLRIVGVKVGLITLMLYLYNNSKYSIWFKVLHNGLKAFYPGLASYKNNVTKSIGYDYIDFNKYSKNFVNHYGFKNVELDWLLSAINKKYHTI